MRFCRIICLFLIALFGFNQIGSAVALSNALVNNSGNSSEISDQTSIAQSKHFVFDIEAKYAFEEISEEEIDQEEEDNISPYLFSHFYNYITFTERTAYQTRLIVNQAAAPKFPVAAYILFQVFRN